MFGRKNRDDADVDAPFQPDDAVIDDPTTQDQDALDAEAQVADGAEAELQGTETGAGEATFDGDPREDGPFDISEVELEGDDTPRLGLGPLTITPFPDMGLQFQGNPETQEVYSALVMHEQSGLQLELFAAPSAGGLAAELREDMLEETQQGGGSAEVVIGPFGHEIKRVLPLEGPEGEQMFHVSRIWLVDGPRWLLRGTLMGQAALTDGEEAPADLFVEFFRNIIVERGDSPLVPGELLTLQLPDLPGAQG